MTAGYLICYSYTIVDNGMQLKRHQFIFLINIFNYYHIWFSSNHYFNSKFISLIIIIFFLFLIWWYWNETNIDCTMQRRRRCRSKSFRCRLRCGVDRRWSCAASTTSVTAESRSTRSNGTKDPTNSSGTCPERIRPPEPSPGPTSTSTYVHTITIISLFHSIQLLGILFFFGSSRASQQFSKLNNIYVIL